MWIKCPQSRNDFEEYILIMKLELDIQNRK